MTIGNESVSKIITNDTINLFSKTAISTLPISNHNSLRVLFDKIASAYFIEKKIYLYFSIGNGQPGEPALCQLYRHTFVPNGSSAQVANVGDSLRRLSSVHRIQDSVGLGRLTGN